MPPNSHRGRCWRRPAPPARSSSGACGRSCRRRPPPTAGIRSRPGARRRRHPGRRPASWRATKAGQRAAPAAVRGMPPKRVPTVSTRQMQRETSATAVTATAIRQARPIRPQPPQTENDGDGAAATARRWPGLIVWICVGRWRRSWAGAARARAASVEAQQVLQLAGENDDRNAGGEADDDRKRDVLDIGAEPQEADRDHHRAGQQRRQHQAVIAVPLDDVRDQAR